MYCTATIIQSLWGHNKIMPFECQCILLGMSSPVICQGNQSGCWTVFSCQDFFLGCYTYCLSTHQNCVPPNTNQMVSDTCYSLKNITYYQSPSPSLSITHSPQIHFSQQAVCAVTFLNTHCPWANDSKENCCLNIYSTPEMSSSCMPKTPLLGSGYTTNVGHQGSPITPLGLCVIHKPAHSNLDVFEHFPLPLRLKHVSFQQYTHPYASSASSLTLYVSYFPQPSMNNVQQVSWKNHRQQWIIDPTEKCKCRLQSVFTHTKLSALLY